MQKFLEGGARHLFLRSANNEHSAQNYAIISSVGLFFLEVDVGGGSNCAKLVR